MTRVAREGKNESASIAARGPTWTVPSTLNAMMSNNPATSLDLSTPLDNIKSLLQQPLRIWINDGRVFIGTFMGTDKPLNLLLIDAEEFRADDGAEQDSRWVGQILVPWRLVTKVEAQQSSLQPSLVGSRRSDSGLYI